MSPDDAGSAKQDKRRERLVASLRENLKRRKAQQRSREAQEQTGEDGKAPHSLPKLDLKE